MFAYLNKFINNEKIFIKLGNKTTIH